MCSYYGQKWRRKGAGFYQEFIEAFMYALVNIAMQLIEKAQ
jgi:hypothetical protein